MQTINVAVLGASGFVGRSVTAALARSPVFTVTAYGHRTGALTLDAKDESALRRALAPVDAVVNCMAGPPADMQAVARALAAVLQSAGSKAPRLVHLSSMAAYGNVSGLVTEEEALQSGLNAYGQAKLEMERILAPLKDVFVFRPGCIYGAGAPLWNTLVEQLLLERRLGDLGHAARACSNLVHVEDVAQAVVLALQQPPSTAQRVFNLAMRDAPSWNGYFAQYAEALGMTTVPRIGALRLAAERWLMGPVLKACEILSARMGQHRKVPARLPAALLELWQQDIRLDARKAESELGIQWTPLAPALREIVAARTLSQQ